MADYARGGRTIAKPRISPIWVRDVVIMDPPKMPAPPPHLDLLDLLFKEKLGVPCDIATAGV